VNELKRDELIEAIDRLGSDSLDVGERARLMGIIHYESAVGQWRPISIWSMLWRSLSYGSIAVRRLGFVPEEDIRRFRETERLLGSFFTVVVGSICFTLFFAALAFPLLKAAKHFGIGSGGFIFVSGLLGGLFFYLLTIRMFKHTPAEPQNAQRFRPWCIGCGYDLEGLESALGDEVWVGSRNCPECGQQYPAVGE